MMRIGCIIGTRPEAIKLAPVILRLHAQPWANTFVIATGQHRELLDDVLDLFDIVPDADLDLMETDQPLNTLFATAVRGLDHVIADNRLDLVIAQGDTTSVMAAAIACFHRRVPFLHVEAGLRSFDFENPFPEELNRIVASRVASLHFAPTANARDNLLREGVESEKILVTGNTVIDALHSIAARPIKLPVKIKRGSRLVLVTAHRRENFGEPLENICRAILSLARGHRDLQILWPVHPNPNVLSTVQKLVGDHPRINLVEPLRYGAFVAAMKQSYLVLTDSGGVQEEAPALGRPVLVMRRETERPEAIEAGVARLVGTDVQSIVNNVRELLDHPASYARMATGVSPYGDGKASARIVQAISMKFAAMVTAESVTNSLSSRSPVAATPVFSLQQGVR